MRPYYPDRISFIPNHFAQYAAKLEFSIREIQSLYVNIYTLHTHIYTQLQNPYKQNEGQCLAREHNLLTPKVCLWLQQLQLSQKFHFCSKDHHCGTNHSQNCSPGDFHDNNCSDKNPGDMRNHSNEGRRRSIEPHIAITYQKPQYTTP